VKSTNPNLRSAGFVLACAVLLAGCGGGVGGTGNVAGGGTGGTGISYGPITGFGSVIVNGVHFDFDPAVVSLNGGGSAGGETGGLEVGMVIRVRGEFNNDGISGTAAGIEYEDSLTGPIADITDVNGSDPRTATVLGQTVIMDSATQFYGFSSNTLAGPVQGQVIELSGLIDEQGRLRATYIRKKKNAWEPGLDLSIKGRVSALTDSTFMINLLTVSYGPGTNVHDVAGGSLSNGDYVKVQGDIASVSATTLDAVEIDGVSEDLDQGDVDKVEIEGYVTVATINGFSIGGHDAVISGSTQYSGSCENLGSITAGTRLEAEGALVSGVLQASKVECR
jgi:hypothetical protein